MGNVFRREFRKIDFKFNLCSFVEESFDIGRRGSRDFRGGEFDIFRLFRDNSLGFCFCFCLVKKFW